MKFCDFQKNSFVEHVLKLVDFKCIYMYTTLLVVFVSDNMNTVGYAEPRNPGKIVSYEILRFCCILKNFDGYCVGQLEEIKTNIKT